VTLAYFLGTNAISGRVRRFKLGETLVCDAQSRGGDASVTLEIDATLFLVERSIFKKCCVFKNEGAPL
jgi:hypothetical protein